MSWTEERISLLKRLCSEGKSAREIATILGEGVTRNAVIGKINRMKLAARKEALAGSKAASPKAAPPKAKEAKKPAVSKPAPKAPTPPRKPAESAPAPSPPPPTSPAADPLPKPEEPREPISPPLIREPDMDEDVDEDVKGASLFGEGGCKWPIGHPGEEDFHFCGERRQDTLPYCKTHAQEAYQMADRRRGRNS
ncbi:MAG: GcrA cell cycle regulator [Hyphomicrobiales bacterium]|nr:GcrA cell cycle regulator [Hyphomicrobiales bacterium]MCY4049505.1 GcrA cell cycle regulator [Hyphomicrobiales bacterium]